MRKFPQLAACTAGVLLSASAMAESSRHVDAHVHGKGELNFAVEGDRVHLELNTPGFDILGFESITTEAQHKQLDEALEKLKAADMWSLTPAASCSLVKANASGNPKKGHNDHDEHGHDDHKDHDDHGHDDHKDHDDHGHDDHKDHDDHGHKEHTNHDAQEDGHMDIQATYVYQCADIDKLNNITTRLFETFPNSDTLQVQGFTSKGQLADQMSRNKAEVRF